MPKQPRAVEWTLFDPWDGCVLCINYMPCVDRDTRVFIRKMIQGAPQHFRRMRRPDGKPLGMRKLRTRTRLFY
jgi:hypothetical protein